jgi:hypothetical protein
VEELIPRIRAVCPTVRNRTLFDLAVRFELGFFLSRKQVIVARNLMPCEILATHLILEGDKK